MSFSTINRKTRTAALSHSPGALVKGGAQRNDLRETSLEQHSCQPLPFQQVLTSNALGLHSLHSPPTASRSVASYLLHRLLPGWGALPPRQNLLLPPGCPGSSGPHPPALGSHADAITKDTDVSKVSHQVGLLFSGSHLVPESSAIV